MKYHMLFKMLETSSYICQLIYNPFVNVAYWVLDTSQVISNGMVSKIIKDMMYKQTLQHGSRFDRVREFSWNFGRAKVEVHLPLTKVQYMYWQHGCDIYIFFRQMQSRSL